MSDLSRNAADLPTVIIGATTAGVATTPVGSDTNGNLLVKDYSDGPVSPGTAASASILTGGQYNSTLPTLTNTQQSAVQLDSSGRLITNVGNSTPPNNLLATGTLTSITSSVSLTLQSTASINVDISGSGFVGTIIVYESTPSEQRNLGVFALNNSAIAMNITGNGNYRVAGVPTSGSITVAFSSYTSGSCTVNIYGSMAPYIVQPYSANAANVLVTSYLNDGSGNSINSVSNALTVNTKSPLTYSAPTTASVGTTSTLILAANSARRGLFLSNTTSQQISLGFNGNAAAYQYGVTLFPGEKFEMDEYSFSTGAIYAITSGTGAYIGIQEMT